MDHSVEKPTLMLTIYGELISIGENQVIQQKDQSIPSME